MSVPSLSLRAVCYKSAAGRESVVGLVEDRHGGEKKKQKHFIATSSYTRCIDIGPGKRDSHIVPVLLSVLGEFRILSCLVEGNADIPAGIEEKSRLAIIFFFVFL